MRKIILLYSAIYPDTAATFIESLAAAKDGDVRVLVNCPGGDPYSTYGMVAMVNSMDNVCYDIHGQASSCAFYLIAGSADKENNTCLDVSSLVAHRAATWMEKYPEMMTDAVKAELESVNKNLRNVIEKGIGADNFKKVTGTSLDDMFAMDKRINVNINAKQAKKLGLVGKIVPLSSKLKAEIESHANTYHIAAFAEGTAFPNLESSSNTEIMDIKTLAELKAAYPALVTEAETAAVTTAMENEKIRVEAWSAWAIVDPEAVKVGIASGKLPTAADTAKFQVKMGSPEILAKMRASNQTVVTGQAADAGKSESDLKADAFLAEVNRVAEVKK